MTRGEEDEERGERAGDALCVGAEVVQVTGSCQTGLASRMKRERARGESEKRWRPTPASRAAVVRIDRGSRTYFSLLRLTAEAGRKEESKETKKSRETTKSFASPVSSVDSLAGTAGRHTG
jgi:membrane-anchored protein YejM (alkaline phosphatase superfamily)